MQHLKLPMALIDPAPFEPASKLKRSIQKDVVACLAESMEKIGLLTPLAVRAAKIIRNGTRVDGWQIIYGHHRMEAAVSLWWKEIDCIVYEDGEINSKAAIISENLHRADLTTEELQNYRAEWAESIMGRKADKLRHDAAVSTKGGRGNKGGVRAAAREMGVSARTVDRAIKASNTPNDAKREAYLEKERERSARNRELRKASKEPSTVVQFVQKPYTESQWNSEMDALERKATIDWILRRAENKRHNSASDISA